MAGENPEDERDRRARRVPVEDEVGAVPGPDHGPGDEPAARVRADGGRAVSGRRGAGASRISRPVVGVVTAGFAGREGRHPAGRSHRRRWPATRVDTWEQFFIAIGTRAEPRGADRPAARRPRADAQGDAGAAPGRAAFEIGDIGVLPNVHPHVASVVAGEPAEQGRPQGRRRRRRRRRRSRSRSRRSCSDAIAKHPEQPIDADDPARRRSRMTIVRSTPRQARRRAAGSASASATTIKSIKPGAVEAVS